MEGQLFDMFVFQIYGEMERKNQKEMEKRLKKRR